MLNELKVDELLGKVDSRYGLVMAGAKRARQINEYTRTLGLNESLGIPGPQVHTRSQHPLSIAIEELRTGKLEVGFREEPGAGEPADEVVAVPGEATDELSEEDLAAEQIAVEAPEDGPEAPDAEEDQGAA